MNRILKPCCWVGLLVALAGCSSQSSARSPDDLAPAEISRDAAVAEARRDAAFHFQEAPLSAVVASRMGRYWVVELRTQGGRGLHYAIATDGAIRERRTIE